MDEVLLEWPSSNIALVRISRPEVKNALNISVRTKLADCFTALDTNSEVRCIVVTGGEEVFAAGADVRDFAKASAIEMYLRNTHKVWQAMTNCAKPIIAAVNGYAFGGGCELAMHADIIIAGEGASFSQPEIKVGIMPGAGGTQRLVRAIGKFQTMKMVLTGLPVTASEAMAMGLVSEVVADNETIPRAVELARLIAKMPPLAVAQIKEVVLAGQDAPLDVALRLERKAFQLLFDSQDQKEGAAAFLERRKPDFQGR